MFDSTVPWFRIEGRPWPARLLRYVIASIFAGMVFGVLRESVTAGLLFGGAFAVWFPILVERMLRRGLR